MDGLYLLCAFACLLASPSASSRLELSAYEYRRRFDRPLDLGMCPDRLVLYPNGVGKHECPYPKRPGDGQLRKKEVHSKTHVIIEDPSELFQHVGICDYKSAEYFGLMSNKKDCFGNEIASKLSFKKKHITFLYFEHYRPSVNILLPSNSLDNIPDSYTLHVNNTYYTDQIGIGTEEAIVVEMQFSSQLLANKTKQYFRPNSQSMSAYMDVIGHHIGLPKKVKVIRLSTADLLMHTKVYRGVNALEDSKRFVRQCEHRIARLRNELGRGRVSSHLRYGFKQYEIGIALPLTSVHVTEQEKRQAWEGVNLLQVKANRIYVTYKRYRKICRTVTHKFCPYIKHTLQELKRVITLIHTQRRDWSQLPYDQQGPWIKKGTDAVQLYKRRLHVTTKALKRWLRQQPNSTHG